MRDNPQWPRRKDAGGTWKSDLAWCRKAKVILHPSTFILGCALAAAVGAQQFPTRPIRIVIPYAAAGGSDITTRIVQPRATEALGQSLIIDNRAGGGTLIGTRMVQAASPDGYTLGVMDPAFIVN